MARTATTPPPRRPTALGMLLLGAAAGYGLAVWMDRNGVTWRDLPARLRATPRPAPAMGAPADAAPPGRLAQARAAARQAMDARRRALEAEAGRALGPDADGAPGPRRNGAGGGAPAV